MHNMKTDLGEFIFLSLLIFLNTALLLEQAGQVMKHLKILNVHFFF